MQKGTRMDIKITPAFLSGNIGIPPSKSISHRALIAASLAQGESTVENLLDCADTEATVEALTALGAKIERFGNYAKITGISKPNKQAKINCRESGSTLRFMIPVAAALGTDAEFSGCGKLPERPITPFFEQLPEHGVEFLTKQMPYRINGRLNGGRFTIAGNISSQFITGLLMAFPLTNEDCEIHITTALESKGYIDLTLDVMERFGVHIGEIENGYFSAKNTSYKPCDFSVEADLSQAAFFLTANAIGSEISIKGINPNSRQGDRAILDITENFVKDHAPFRINASQIPDLVPILTVLACFADGESEISGCERLRIKECDRLAAISQELNKLGAKIEIIGDSLKITGVKELHGGECDAWNDHRIAMSLAVASTRSTAPIIIRGAECVSKSYPHFFEDFRMLGGITDVI